MSNERPEARLPSRWAIASYWAGRDDWFDVVLARPHCFACGLHGGWPESVATPEERWNSSRRLERGHIVNRARFGLDGAQNLVPLCTGCNRLMPIFDYEHEDDATAWIIGGGAVGELERRLEAAGASHAEVGYWYLDFMEQRGGIVWPDGMSTERARAAISRQAALTGTGHRQ